MSRENPQGFVYQETSWESEEPNGVLLEEFAVQAIANPYFYKSWQRIVLTAVLAVTSLSACGPNTEDASQLTVVVAPIAMSLEPAKIELTGTPVSTEAPKLTPEPTKTTEAIPTALPIPEAVSGAFGGGDIPDVVDREMDRLNGYSQGLLTEDNATWEFFQNPEDSVNDGMAAFRLTRNTVIDEREFGPGTLVTYSSKGEVVPMKQGGDEYIVGYDFGLRTFVQKTSDGEILQKLNFETGQWVVVEAVETEEVEAAEAVTIETMQDFDKLFTEHEVSSSNFTLGYSDEVMREMGIERVSFPVVNQEELFGNIRKAIILHLAGRASEYSGEFSDFESIDPRNYESAEDPTLNVESSLSLFDQKVEFLTQKLWNFGHDGQERGMGTDDDDVSGQIQKVVSRVVTFDEWGTIDKVLQEEGIQVRHIEIGKIKSLIYFQDSILHIFTKRVDENWWKREVLDKDLHGFGLMAVGLTSPTASLEYAMIEDMIKAEELEGVNITISSAKLLRKIVACFGGMSNPETFEATLI